MTQTMTPETQARADLIAELGRKALNPGTTDYITSLLKRAAAQIEADTPKPVAFSGKLDGLSDEDSALVIRTLGPPQKQLSETPDDGLPLDALTPLYMGAGHLAQLLAAARSEGKDAFMPKVETLRARLEKLEKELGRPGFHHILNAIARRREAAIEQDDQPTAEKLHLLHELARVMLMPPGVGRLRSDLERHKHIGPTTGAETGAQIDGPINRQLRDQIVEALTGKAAHPARPGSEEDLMRQIRESAERQGVKVMFFGRRYPAPVNFVDELEVPTDAQARAMGYTESEIADAKAIHRAGDRTGPYPAESAPLEGNPQGWIVGMPEDALLPPVKSLRDAARNAALRVLRQHHYNIPGVADIALGAALRVIAEGVTPDHLEEGRMAGFRAGSAGRPRTATFRAIIQAILDAK